MDPYLQSLWHDFHERFIPAAAAHLAAQVRPRYIVLIDETVYLHDIPPEQRRPLWRPDLLVARRAGTAARAAAVGILEAPAQVLLPEQDAESLLPSASSTARAAS